MKERKVTIEKMGCYVREYGYKSFRSQLYRIDYEGEDKEKLLKLLDECARSETESVVLSNEKTVDS